MELVRNSSENGGGSNELVFAAKSAPHPFAVLLVPDGLFRYQLENVALFLQDGVREVFHYLFGLNELDERDPFAPRPFSSQDGHAPRGPAA